MKALHAAPVAMCLALVVLTSCSGDATKDVSNRITAEKAYALINETPPPFVIDVRTTMEYRADRLNNAVHVPVQKFVTGSYKKSLKEVSKDRPILVYCRHGVRSRLAQKVLSSAGYSQAVDLKGGTVAWKEAGFPMDQSKPGG